MCRVKRYTLLYHTSCSSLIGELPTLFHNLMSDRKLTQPTGAEEKCPTNPQRKTCERNPQNCMTQNLVAEFYAAATVLSVMPNARPGPTGCAYTIWPGSFNKIALTGN